MEVVNGCLVFGFVGIVMKAGIRLVEFELLHLVFLIQLQFHQANFMLKSFLIDS